MMRMMNNKANVKIFSIVIAAIFIIGIGALAYAQMATPSGNSGNSTIGVIDTSRMMSQDNPIYISAAQEYMSYQSQLQKETQAKIDAAQDDATKQKLAEEARQNLAKKDQEIAKSVQDKAMEAAKAVGDAKGASDTEGIATFTGGLQPTAVDSDIAVTADGRISLIALVVVGGGDVRILDLQIAGRPDGVAVGGSGFKSTVADLDA